MCLFRNKSISEKAADLIKTEKPDFANLFENISHREDAINMYKELSSLLHPDRFVGKDELLSKRAMELFKETQNAKTDLERLLHIKEEAINLLEQITDR